MALSNSGDFGGLDSRNDESPCTTSSDDLFADINWPEDEADSPFDEGQFFIAMNSDHSTESPKDDINNSPTYSNNSGSDKAAELSLPAPDTSQSKKCTGGCRFSKEVKSILRTWFNEHKDNPYPTPEEKRELAEKTQLRHSQISLWLVNTRRRHRSRKQRDARPDLLPHTMPPPPVPGRALGVSHGRNTSVSTQRPFEEMNPMDRWKYVTPLELEPAETDVILGTVAAAPPLSFDPYNVSRRHPAGRFDSDLQSSACLSNNDYFNDYLPSRSIASYETGLTSLITGSTISDSTLFSYPSQGGARDRRRRRGNPMKTPKPSGKDRLFQCTFCDDTTFATKHDWQRHEKSQHLSLESWTCCLSGGTIATPIGSICAFCDLLDPSPAHLEMHSFSACQEKGLRERTFYRKDHFQQHLRLTHESKFRSVMDSWKAEIPIVRSRCGFCSATFTTWTGRADHLAAHFKCRATMNDWIGDWGFEPHIAALVERAAPKNTLALTVAVLTTMPPPSQFYKHLGSTGLGGGGVYEMPQPGFTSEEIDNIIALSAGMGSASMNTGFLGLDNDIISDWVDFGV